MHVAHLARINVSEEEIEKYQMNLAQMIDEIDKIKDLNDFDEELSANIVILTLFILLWAFIPQEINIAVLPLVLCLWIRSASNLILTYKPKTK